MTGCEKNDSSQLGTLFAPCSRAATFEGDFTMTQMQVPLVALFEQREQARRAVHDLREAGFTEDRLGMITRDNKETAAAVMPTEESKWPEAVVDGAPTR